MKKNLTIDIGGTKTRVMLWGNERCIFKKDIPTKQYLKGNGRKDLERLLAVIQTLFPKEEYDKIGVSYAGGIDGGKIIYSLLLGGKVSINTKELFSTYFCFQKFSIENDVTCMAFAEKKVGIGKKTNNFLYINLGTGIRVIAVSDGTIMRGILNQAGEVYLIPIWVEELQKYIPLEQIASGRGISYLASILYNENSTAETVFAQKKKKAIIIFCKYLSQFLITASYFYNPEEIVFSGSLTKSARLWLPQVSSMYKKMGPEICRAKRITISSVKDPASLGALLLNNYE